MNSRELARYNAGLTLADLAEKADVNERTLRRIENGEVKRPSAPLVKAIADVCGVTVAQYLGVDELGAAA